MLSKSALVWAHTRQNTAELVGRVIRNSVPDGTDMEMGLQQRGQCANQERRQIQGKPEQQHVGTVGHGTDTWQSPGSFLLFSQRCHRNRSWPLPPRYVTLGESGVLAQRLAVCTVWGQSYPLSGAISSGRVDGGSKLSLMKI